MCKVDPRVVRVNKSIVTHYYNNPLCDIILLNHLIKHIAMFRLLCVDISKFK